MKRRERSKWRTVHLLTTCWLMPSLSKEAILASSLQFVYWTQHCVVWDIPLFNLGQLSRLPAVYLLTGRAWESQKSLIWGKLYSATAKKLVCYQHKFKTGTMPAAKKKNNSPSWNQDRHSGASSSKLGLRKQEGERGAPWVWLPLGFIWV